VLSPYQAVKMIEIIATQYCAGQTLFGPEVREKIMYTDDVIKQAWLSLQKNDCVGISIVQKRDLRGTPMAPRNREEAAYPYKPYTT